MRISDWSSDVCSSDLVVAQVGRVLSVPHGGRIDHVLGSRAGAACPGGLFADPDGAHAGSREGVEGEVDLEGSAVMARLALALVLALLTSGQIGRAHV